MIRTTNRLLSISLDKFRSDMTIGFSLIRKDRLQDLHQNIKRRIASLSNTQFILILSLCTTLGWLAVFWPRMDTYWNWDDLHLIRQFSPAELSQVFHDNWDLDKVETEGFRPFTVVFNHFRAVIAGERPLAQRTLILVLNGVLFWLIGWLSIKLHLRRAYIAWALLILMSTRVVAGDILWISDGVHIFEWFVFALATVMMIIYLDNRAFKMGFLLSIVLIWVCLWTREDSLVIIPLMLILLVAYCIQLAPNPRIQNLVSGITRDKPILLFMVVLCALGILTMAYRQVLLPTASMIHPPHWAIAGYKSSLKWTALIVGDYAGPNAVEAYMQSGSPIFTVLTRVWKGMLVVISASFLLVSRPPARRYAGVGLLGIALACLPSLSQARPNLLFLPTIFFCFTLAIALVEIWTVASMLVSRSKVDWSGGICSLTNRSERFGGRIRSAVAYLLRVVVIIGMCMAVGGSLFRASVQTVDLHEMSVNQIWRDSDAIFGNDGHILSSIPPQRLNTVLGKLIQWGIHTTDDTRTILPQLYDEAIASGRFAPDAEARPFVPPVMFLSP
jgi:hypothetical protein